MSETSNSAGVGFTATQSTSTPISSNSAEPTGLPPGYGGKFFDDGDDGGPVVSSREPAATIEELSADSEGNDTTSESAGEVADEVQEATGEAKGETKPAAKVKTYKINVNGKQVDVPIDAKFTIPVDGKSTPVTFNELVQSYNGKVSWDKRFTELDKSRKDFGQEKSAFTADKQALNDGLGQFFQLVQQKKGPQAWAHLIKMAGLENQYSLADLRKEVYEQQRALEAMSPEQRKAQEAQEQAEFYRSEFEGLTNRQKAQQAQAQAEKALEQVLESHSITREQFGQLYSQLTQGGVHPDAITPELVIDYNRRIEAYTAIRQAAEKVDPAILKDEKLVSRLRDFKLANPDITSADMRDVLRTWKGDSRARKISDKLRQTKTATSATLRQPTPARTNNKFEREDFFF